MTNNIPYVIGFPIYEDRVLLIKRNVPPWFKYWNGLGGKIEVGETAQEAMVRELGEEAGITLANINNMRFAGIATWNVNSHNKENKPGGMYIFIIDILDGNKILNHIDTREGEIGWMSIKWACNEKNNKIAGNIPIYLPHILNNDELHDYHFTFDNYEIVKSEIIRLNYKYRI